MMRLKYFPVLAICTMAIGCTSSKQPAELTSGLDLANLDTTALPGTSFYQYACGGWMKNNPLTAEYSRYGSFNRLAENNQKQLQGLIEELAKTQHEDGTVAQKIGDLYNIAMDSVKLNKEAFAPIQEEMKKLAELKDKAAIYPVISSMQQRGMYPYFILYVSADNKNSSMNIVQLGQGGLGMDERDYYLGKDEKTVALRNAYQKHIVAMFRLAGLEEAAAQKAMQSVMTIENRLAKAARSQILMRDPNANYNKKSLSEFKKEIPAFAWDAFFKAGRLPEVKELNMGQPESIKEVVALMNSLPIEDHIAYLQWNLINSAAHYLSDDFVREDFEFYGKTMTGAQEMKPRWKNAVKTVDDALGEAVGQMYVEKYFPAASKERMVTLVKNLQTALGERINNLTWMGDSTKQKAQEKLAAFHVKIGYPDKWKDYSSLKVQNDSYWANIERANQWAYQEMITKAGKPVDKEEWLMTPQTVNAYYNPSTNEICFPAGILQYPFFDRNADDAFNYGAIGVVIGHEMTHGFDDQGRQFDKEGNLKDWWTEEDAKNFDARAAVMVNFFDSIQVAPGVHANGRFTLGENIADHGGLQVSFQAFKQATAGAPLAAKDGFSPEQRFFLAYATLWAMNIREEEVLRLTKLDVHSLGKWRIDGALPHIAAWYEAFGITPEDSMFLPVEKRVSIW